MSNKTVPLRGLSIFQDERGRNIYFDRISKMGYVIQDKDVKMYTVYSNRYIIPITAAILLGYFVVEPIWAALFAVVLIIVMEVMFRKRFLPSLTRMEKFKPTKRASMLQRVMDTNDKKKVLVQTLLYLSLAVLLVWNAMDMGMQGFMFGASCALSLAAIGAAILHIVAYIKMK